MMTRADFVREAEAIVREMVSGMTEFSMNFPEVVLGESATGVPVFSVLTVLFQEHLTIEDKIIQEKALAANRMARFRQSCIVCQCAYALYDFNDPGVLEELKPDQRPDRQDYIIFYWSSSVQDHPDDPVCWMTSFKLNRTSTGQGVLDTTPIDPSRMGLVNPHALMPCGVPLLAD